MKCDRPSVTALGKQGFQRCQGQVRSYGIFKGPVLIRRLALCEACVASVKRDLAVANVIETGGSIEGPFRLEVLKKEVG